jgi:hypothetical protein
VAAALATIPVPITDANQLGVRFTNTDDGCSSSRKNVLVVLVRVTVGVFDMASSSSPALSH